MDATIDPVATAPPETALPSRRADFKFWEFVMYVGVFAILAAFVLVAAYYLFEWSPIAAGALHAILLLFIFLAGIGYSMEKKERLAHKYQTTDEDAEEIALAWLLVSIIVAVLCFGEICRSVHVGIGDGYFTGVGDGYVYWLRYGALNVCEGVLLDSPSVFRYDIRISEAEAARIPSQTFVFLFRFLLAVLILENIRHWFGWTFGTWKIFGGRKV